MTELTLTKDNVVAPDGAVYSVKVRRYFKIFETFYGAGCGWYVAVALTNESGEEVYDPVYAISERDDDIAAFVRQTVTKHTENLRLDREAAAREQAVIDAFNAWDGRVA
jgi:hypothetical protein